MQEATFQSKVGLARMLAGGAIMDVTDADQARIAQEAGATAVMALERVPADIRRDGGVARASDPERVTSIQQAVSIPVMAKCRIGHFMEARVLEALEVDFVDESEVLSPADEAFHIDKGGFRVPFVCGCTDLGEALRRIGEGAALLRTKGEAGTGNIIEAVRHLRALRTSIRRLGTLGPRGADDRGKGARRTLPAARRSGQPRSSPGAELRRRWYRDARRRRLCMALGAEAVFVGSGIFLSSDPAARARAIVEATTHWEDPAKLAEISTGLGEAMAGLEISSLAESERYATRGW